MKKLIVYDLDGTLAGSKSSLDAEMAALRDILGISLREMICVGDALFPGGNDYPAKEAGVVCVGVRGPRETKPVTAGIVACLGSL